MNITKALPLVLVLMALLCCAHVVLAQTGKTKISIVNVNAPNVGFNDPAPRAPVGGNPGTTLGQQRLNVFQRAADIWGAALDSNVEILIQASFEPLTCTPTSAVLGSAGTIIIIRDFQGTGLFPGAEFPSTFYHIALANKRAGVDLAPPGMPGLNSNDIVTRFNSNIGQPGCLTGSSFYLGLDNKVPAGQINLLAVVLHEFAHGLGFSQFASVTTGAQPQNLTDVYGRRILDLTTGKHWNEMTNAERVASAINARRVVFDGANVSAALTGVLAPGTPLLRINAPATIAGVFPIGTAQFGAPLSAAGVTGQLVLAQDAANAAGPLTTDACSTLTNAAAVAGKIAVIDRGTCGFTIKVKNAQDAGAIGVVIVENVGGSPPVGLGGVDATITIPSVRVSLKDGNMIKARLAAGETLISTLRLDLNVRSGADPLGRALLNAPDPVQPGSSISHYDPLTTPNQLMEPAINGDLTQSVKPPQDLTLPLMRDIGWFADIDVDGLADNLDECVSSDRSLTVTIGSCDTGVNNLLLSSGCTLKDKIATFVAAARSNGQFISSMVQFTDQLVASGTLSSADRDKLIACARQNFPAINLQFSAPSFTVTEGDGSATVSVTRTGAFNSAVSVRYATSNGSAQAGSDYTAVSGTLNFTANGPNTLSFTIPILDDKILEGVESMQLVLTDANGGADLGDIVVANLTINDDDGRLPDAVVQFTAPSFTVREGDGFATISVNCQGNLPGPVSVFYATSNGSARAGADYRITDGQITFSPGDGGIKTFTIPIIDDNVPEGRETVQVSLTGPNGVALGTLSTALVTIIDNDGNNSNQLPTLDFTTSFIDARESDGVVRITVKRSGNLEVPVAVRFAITGGSAIEGGDFQFDAASLMLFEAGEEQKSINLLIVDDQIPESAETIRMDMATSDQYLLGVRRSLVIRITDDDAAQSARQKE